MKVLITGGNGFSGHHLVEAIIKFLKDDKTKIFSKIQLIFLSFGLAQSFPLHRAVLLSHGKRNGKSCAKGPCGPGPQKNFKWASTAALPTTVSWAPGKDFPVIPVQGPALSGPKSIPGFPHD